MENYSPALDSMFHALADPTRRAVLHRLGQGPASIGDLAEPYPMGLPSFLKHINTLEQSGLIATQKVGRVRTCTLNRANLAAAERWFAEQRTLWSDRYDNLDTLLTILNGDDHEA